MDLMTADVGWNGAPIVAKNVVSSVLAQRVGADQGECEGYIAASTPNRQAALDLPPCRSRAGRQRHRSTMVVPAIPASGPR